MRAMGVDLLEVLARVWSQLDTLQAVLFVALLTLVSCLLLMLSHALLMGVWDAVWRIFAHVQSQTPHGKALARSAADEAARESNLIQRTLQFEEAQPLNAAPRTIPPPPDIPRWLAIVGWLIGIALGLMLATGLSLILSHAHHHHVVEFSFRSGRVAINRGTSPTLFWGACFAFASLTVAAMWAVIEALLGLWRRIFDGEQGG